MKMIGLFVVLVLFVGCSSSTLVNNNKKVPSTANETISLFKLNNYTDTPRAGMRSSNIIEGILLAKGLIVTSHISNDMIDKKAAQRIAKKDNSKYFFIGGVSEWRYKTGIDGEPAVSMQCSIYETNSLKLVWSATGADSDWGTGSIGTTAQNLLETMMQN